MPGKQMNHDQEWSAHLSQAVDEDGPMLFRVAYRILHDRAAAEDVCQQALLKAWQQSDRIESPSRLRAWLTRVVVNESLYLLRRGKVNRKMLDQRVQDSPSHVRPNDRFELRDAIVAAMDQLDDRTKTVIVLRLMEGLSGNQVKDRLGCSASEVSRRLHQGMEQLRESLHELRAVATR